MLFGEEPVPLTEVPRYRDAGRDWDTPGRRWE